MSKYKIGDKVVTYNPHFIYEVVAVDIDLTWTKEKGISVKKFAERTGYIFKKATATTMVFETHLRPAKEVVHETIEKLIKLTEML